MKKKAWLITVFWVLGFFINGSETLAQNFPDTIWVPVTFYDFHPDRSNPEFEQIHFGTDTARTGMVQDTLDKDDKPVPGPRPYMNHYMKYWFRAWEDSAKGDYTIPHYSPRAEQAMGRDPEREAELLEHFPDFVIPEAGLPERFGEGFTENCDLNVPDFEPWMCEYRRDVEFLGIDTVDHDTSFKNVVVEDSLPFIHIGDGMYRFRDSTFFPLDDRGLAELRGCNGWNHELENYWWNTDSAAADENELWPIDANRNFSFTMELHWTFVKEEGMQFRFEGDDDVFVFVDRRLVIELGGIHEAVADSFYVDDLDHLEYGQEYDLHVFYAERHSSASTIWIETNLIPIPPSVVEISVAPDTTIYAFDTIFGHVAVYADSGEGSTQVNDPPGEFVWGFVDEDASNPPSSLVDNDTSITFTPTRGPTLVKLWCNYVDAESDIEITDTVRIHVLSIPTVTSLYPEEGPPDEGENTPLGAVDTVIAGETFDIYARVFDFRDSLKGKRYEHLESSVRWEVEGDGELTDYLSENSGPHTEFYTTAAHQTVTVRAIAEDPSDPTFDRSEAQITIHVVPASPSALFIEESMDLQDSPIAPNPVDTVILTSMTRDQTLYAIVRDRFGNYIGPSADPQWSKNNEDIVLQIDSEAPYTITVSRALYSQTATEITVEEGELEQAKVDIICPDLSIYTDIRLYGDEESPDNAPLGDSLTVTAGESLDLFGRVFDPENRIDHLEEFIEWSVVGTSQTDEFLSESSGHHTVFRTTRAHQHVTIEASVHHPENDVYVASSVRLTIQVVPARAYQLVIEESLHNADPWNPNPVTLVLLNNISSTKTLYAVQRDRYNNLVGPAQEPLWNSDFEGVLVDVDPQSPYRAIVGRDHYNESLSKVTVTEQGLMEAMTTVECPRLHSPTTVVLYPLEGTPGEEGNEPLGAVDTAVAGQPFNLYGRVFDRNEEWVSELDEMLRWRVVGGSNDTLISPKDGDRTVFMSTKAHQSVIIEASLEDSRHPEYGPSTVQITLHVIPAEPYKLHIQDTPDIDLHEPTETDTLRLDNKATRVTLFAVIRDEFGNYIRDARNPQWISENTNAAVIDNYFSNQATISRSEGNIDFLTAITATEGDLLSDSAIIMVEGTTALVPAPNPYTPSTKLSDIFDPITLEYYRDIIQGRERGIMVVMNTKLPLKQLNDGTFGRGIVYDAVGNVVAEVEIKQAKGELTYGIFWDMTNARNREVGPGAYLFKVVNARYINGQMFTGKQMLGIAGE
ncbi:fibro-slime domain-containing protein [Chitinispirillales bacterium ANBcel5]|uniref:fibro-slime domain-containing protein n=1 Tax=Cellulosispirillum alkaliphilum TaxID=3039283 RepID=UPI002A5528EA|nr:fibro-slime domain-containing protein [Chitinispirillales bacterium ANBcel5]